MPCVLCVLTSLRAGRGNEGTHQGLRQHGQTSRIMPKINRRWQVVDLTCHGSSETGADGTISPLSEQAGGIAMRTGDNSCWIKAGRGFLNGQDLRANLCCRTHEGMHLRFLQSRSTGGPGCSLQTNLTLIDQREPGTFRRLGCSGDFCPLERFCPKLPFAPSRRSSPVSGFLSKVRVLAEVRVSPQNEGPWASRHLGG